MGNVNIHREIRTEDDEIEDIIERTLCYTPEERLRNLGEMRDFIYNHMTPEGKKYFEKSREAGYPINISERGLSNLEIDKIESKIRENVKDLPDCELKKAYKGITIGSSSYTRSFGGVSNLREGQETEMQLIHRAAYANALSTYKFVKKIILEGTSKKLKIKRDNKHSEFVDPKQVFEDAVRRIAICEEYAKRI